MLLNVVQLARANINVYNMAGEIVELLGLTGRKVLSSTLASTAKGAQLERLIVSPCEIIKIC
jgi:hypothetical protein